MPKSSRSTATAFAAARLNSVTSSGEPQPSVGSHARRHPVRFPLIYMSANVLDIPVEELFTQLKTSYIVPD